MNRCGEESEQGAEIRPHLHRSLSSQASTRDESVQSPGQECAVRLRCIHPPNDSDDSDIDIIAIHGLDTKSPDTWIWKDPKNPSKSGVNWLQDKDMLPNLVGRARIFTCDWPADLYEDSNLVPKMIDEFARLLLNSIRSLSEENRPILFITSCLGGIILIKALCMATGKYSCIKTSARGFIFLATPFRGISSPDIVHWGEPFLRNWASIQNKHVTTLLGNTKSTSDLREAVRGFTQICIEQNYEICTFYEQGVSNLSHKLLDSFANVYQLVDVNSATLDIDDHPLPLDRPHVLMNKFQGPLDADYKAVSREVKRLLAKVRAGTPLEKADTWIHNNYYTKETLKIQRLSGDLLPMDQCYVNLAIVRQIGKDSSMDIAHQSSPFSLSSRLRVEEPDEKLQVELQALFNPRKMSDGSIKQPRRILIRGRAGVGKTTLCKKIVHDFIHSNTWKNLFQRILWIPLRNMKFTRPCNFKTLLYNQYFVHCPEGKNHASNLNDVIQHPIPNGGRTLFILDGLDEVQNLGGEQNNEYQVLTDLLKQPDVIITTRPHATFPAGSGQFDLELETIGFYPYQVQCYLEKVVQDLPTLQGILSSIQKHWHIQSLVRIPIQLDALCLAWDEIPNNPTPETMTTVYKAIVLRLWKKDIVRLREKGDPEYPITKYTLPSQIWDLSDPDSQLLGCFAFSGMYSNEVEFQPEHQNKVYGLISSWTALPTQVKISFHDRLGCLSFLRSSDPSIDTSNRSYHFLHLTFQEFFAAHYFVRQWMLAEDLEYLDLNSGNKQRSSPVDFLNQNKYDPRYNIMWRFTTGLLEAEGADEATKFFQQLEKEPRDLLGPTHQRLVMHCFSEVVDPQSRPELAEKLSQWLLFEGDLTEHLRLVSESGVPDQVLRTFDQVFQRRKKRSISKSHHRFRRNSGI
ncbi:uncharacterized protein GGS22DRAFT_181385 [Annulohypoxylon maeteangense]|uniref:uncharacterized protein n=1 Tax=Annulohypoxylon maeteangense TaxID=1927788 RepID=UPI002008B787|nr:uncharacterized protein GGS22DRAFT_181385 [Annulohypoxylon maeteangense]KAI0881995.1 hypothetical protein GGS22DRAFT_181385 [Annulohypoxylon maeteangense]